LVVGALVPASREKAARKIQLAYLNKYDTIFKYKKSFLSNRIDFFSYLGPTCPLCGEVDCYRQITPYFRYAIELFPGFKKKQVPVARFLCRRKGRTFSLLPIQLIPYFQYTAAAVVGTLLVGFKWWLMGRRGLFGASLEVDPDSLLTPYLVAWWLKAVVRGFRRAHAVLRRFLDLSNTGTSVTHALWEEVGNYFLAFGMKLHSPWPSLLSALLHRYSLITTQFLFGTASQYRASRSH
jgi:hypothetical protein